MANELTITAAPIDTGLTVTADVVSDAGVTAGSGIAMTEVSSSSVYRGDMPSASAGTYFVRLNASGSSWFQYCIYWDGSAVVDPAAGLGGIEAKVDTIDTVVDSISADLAVVDTNVDAISLTVTDTNTDVGTVNTAVNTISTNLSTVDGKIDTIDTNVDTINTTTGTISTRTTEVWQDRGLDASNAKTVTEVTQSIDYDEDVGSIHKDVTKTGSTTTITRA